KRPVKQVAALGHVVAETAAGGFRLAADTQAVAKSRCVQPNEKLRIATAPRAAPAKGDPQSRVVGPRPAEIVFADAGQRPAAPRLGVEVPAVYAVHHRLDVPRCQGSAQFHEGFAHRETVTVALALHPVAAVVAGQFAQEMKRIRTE